MCTACKTFQLSILPPFFLWITLAVFVADRLAWKPILKPQNSNWLLVHIWNRRNIRLSPYLSSASIVLVSEPAAIHPVSIGPSFEISLIGIWAFETAGYVFTLNDSDWIIFSSDPAAAWVVILHFLHCSSFLNSCWATCKFKILEPKTSAELISGDFFDYWPCSIL